MPEFTFGRFLGIVWCCSLDACVENDVAFGFTRKQAERRCRRRFARRTAEDENTDPQSGARGHDE